MSGFNILKEKVDEMQQAFSHFSEVKLSAPFFTSSHTSASLYIEVAKAQNMNNSSKKYTFMSVISLSSVLMEFLDCNHTYPE